MRVINSLKNLRHYLSVDSDLPNRFICIHIYKYTECGAWIQLKDESGWHGEDSVDNVTSITAIRIGSIVEGSDIEIGPYELTIPFTSKEFEETINQVEDEAEEVWLEANE